MAPKKQNRPENSPSRLFKEKIRGGGGGGCLNKINSLRFLSYDPVQRHCSNLFYMKTNKLNCSASVQPTQRRALKEITMAIFTNVRLNDQSRRSELGERRKQHLRLHVLLFCSFSSTCASQQSCPTLKDAFPEQHLMV